MAPPVYEVAALALLANLPPPAPWATVCIYMHHSPLSRLYEQTGSVKSSRGHTNANGIGIGRAPLAAPWKPSEAQRAVMPSSQTRPRPRLIHGKLPTPGLSFLAALDRPQSRARPQALEGSPRRS